MFTKSLTVRNALSVTGVAASLKMNWGLGEDIGPRHPVKCRSWDENSSVGATVQCRGPRTLTALLLCTSAGYEQRGPLMWYGTHFPQKNPLPVAGSSLLSSSEIPRRRDEEREVPCLGPAGGQSVRKGSQRSLA